jgi:hypothetical protein
MKIDLKKLIVGKITYPSWTTNSTYPLKYEENNSCIFIYYITKTNKRILREFPKEIFFTPHLIYVFGFLKGEGSTALGKSNYRRLTITNTDDVILKITLNELEKSGLFKTKNIINKSIHISHHTKDDEEVLKYWSKKLNLPIEKFKCFELKAGRNPYGVCHIYISDVLLRRVVDIIHEEIFLNQSFLND